VVCGKVRGRFSVSSAYLLVLWFGMGESEVQGRGAVTKATFD